MATLDCEYVQSVMLYAIDQHGRQVRKSGEPFVIHPLRVTRSFAKNRQAPEVLAAALTHDVVEDCPVTIQELEEVVGAKAAHLVGGVTKVETIEQGFKSKVAGLSSNEREREMEATQDKMLRSSIDDGAVIPLRIEDKQDNLETLGPMPAEHQQRKAKEAVEIYIPLLDRLCMGRHKRRFADLTFMYLHPEDYQQTTKFVDDMRDRRGRYIEEVEERLTGELARSHIPATVKGRPRSLSSVHRKRQTHYEQNRSLDQVSDLVIIVVITEDTQGCYAALGAVHGTYREIRGLTIDYISQPKRNGYESIHTYVRDDANAPVQVLIRTREMHDYAENGLPSRWRYRQDGPQADRTLPFKRELEDAGKLADYPEEMVELAQSHILTSESDLITVYSAGNEKVHLRRGSTALDFALKVDFDLGLHAAGAVISGKRFPLNTVLGDQQTVVINYDLNRQPDLDWCDPDKGLVKDRASRIKLEAWFAMRDYNTIFQDGCTQLSKVAGQLDFIGCDFASASIAAMVGYESLDDLIVALGSGRERVADVAVAVANSNSQQEEEFSVAENGGRMCEWYEDLTDVPKCIEVVGNEFANTEFSECCTGLAYGSDCVGYYNADGKVGLHRRDCDVILRPDQLERIVEVKWSEKLVGELVTLEVRGISAPGTAARIFDIFDRENINVDDFHTVEPRRTQESRLQLTFRLEDTVRLMKIRDEILAISGVSSVERVVETQFYAA